jgi:hypothetical protein
MCGGDRLDLLVARPREQHRSASVVEQLGDDAHALLGGLAGPVDRFGHALPDGAVMVDERVPEVGEREPFETCHGVVG